MMYQRVTGEFPTIPERLRSPKKKTAAPAGPRNGGEKQSRKLDKTSKAQHRANAFHLATLRFKGIISNEGYFQGWEVA